MLLVLARIGDPIAWLSELYKDRKYIQSNISFLNQICSVSTLGE